MSISQAGLYKLTLYEAKDFSFLYESSGEINLASISNSGAIIELETNENYPKYSNPIGSAGNNAVLNNHALAFQINGLIQANIDTMEQIQSSIYGWIPLLEFMDNQIYLINTPFVETINPFDSQITHTFFIEMKPRIPSLKALEKVIEITGIVGLLNFDGVDDYVELNSMPDVTGSKTISFKTFLPLNPNLIPSQYSRFLLNFITIGTISDCFYAYYSEVPSGSGNYYLIFGVNNSGSSPHTISVDYDSYSNQILSISVIKNTSVITDLIINGNSIALSNPSNSSYTNSTTNGLIGENLVGVAGMSSNALIWDININNEHQWQGQPDGNLDSAWIDTIGSIDGTVFGSPSTINLP